MTEAAFAGSRHTPRCRKFLKFSTNLYQISSNFFAFSQKRLYHINWISHISPVRHQNGTTRCSMLTLVFVLPTLLLDLLDKEELGQLSTRLV